LKVALVHDWLTGLRGGERCLDTFLQLYPEADVFALLHVPGTTTSRIDARVRRTSWLQRLPGVRRYYRWLLPLYPFAIASLDLRGYDLVISLSHAAAKNVKVPKGVRHICYCFTPMRYIWDQAQAYFGRMAPILQPLLRALQRWDLAGSRRVDHFVAISRFVAARIRCFYGRRATVIYPPVVTDWISPLRSQQQPSSRGRRSGEAFLYAGALVPYKRVDVVVEAFNRLGVNSWVAGSGPESVRLRALAGRNVSFFGGVSDAELAGLYAESRALIFPGTEDFGMVPIECLAAGRPVIARYAGALRESLNGLKAWVLPTPAQVSQAAGVFFRPSSAVMLGADGEPLDGQFARTHSPHELEVRALVQAVEFFMRYESQIRVDRCVAQARLFGPERFASEWDMFLAANGIDDRAARITAPATKKSVVTNA